jgi:hypothetical protein
MEHVPICNRCKDFDIDACNAHASIILKLNNDVANLNAQLKTCQSENDKIIFARDAYTIGRHPSMKDGLGFQKGTKNLTSQRASNLIEEKGKAPMASGSHSSHDKKNHAYLYAHVKNASSIIHHNHVVFYTRHDAAFDSYVMFASSSSSYAHGRNRPRRHTHHIASHAPRNHLMVQLCFIILMMLHLCLCVKMIKLLLEMWDLSARKAKFAFGFQSLM